MAWYVYVVYFFVGALLANSIPHIVHGMSGNKFQTPFAKPPGVGESSAIVNVVWGFANLLIASVLLHAFGSSQLPPPWPLCFAAGLGAFAVGLFLAYRFGTVRNEAPRP